MDERGRNVGSCLNRTQNARSRLHLTFSLGTLLAYSLGRVIRLVADLLHPVDEFTIECLRNGDVCHGFPRRCTMPVSLAGLEPNHIPRADLFYGSPIALN